MPVGGFKEKVLAAHRAGLRTLIIPKKNEKDLVEIPRRVRRELELVLVEHMDEVLQIALDKPEKEGQEGAQKEEKGEASEG